MTLVTHKKTCIILSQGPVPTPEHMQVEGGGLRCWGLAKGILANDKNIDITVAYHESYAKDNFTNSYEGITLKMWSHSNVAELISQYDSVLVSYCMGELSVEVANSIRPDQQLILDCYVPIYVEVSARESPDVEGEYRAFETDVEKWRHVLQRGDLFLCANPAQKSFYQGVLAAVGRVNPITYGDDLIMVVPYGVYRDEPKAMDTPITKLLDTDDDVLKVLWFGGIYPWFDVRNLADAVKEVNKTQPAKLIVVGAKNPFNKHPDFIARYEEFMDYVTTDEMKHYVVVQDWIDFNDRANWYLDADVVVVFNKEGEENKLAWRTRLVDFMWADLPVLTNGGDPLGEIMLAHKAAVRMRSLEAKDISASIINFLGNDKSKISQLKQNMHALKVDFYWDTVTKALTSAIDVHTRARDLRTIGIFSNTYGQHEGTRSKLGKVIGKAKKVPAYARKYGYKATALAINELVRGKIGSKLLGGPTRRKPAYVFVSHQLDMSGAPFIAIDMAIDFKAKGKNVEFYTYLPTHNQNFAKLNKVGIKPHVLMNKDMVPHFIQGDTVILNTVAHSEVSKEAIFSALEAGILKQVIWYLHEDDPELLFRPDEQKRIGKLLNAGTIKLLVPAQKIWNNYIKYFETKKNIQLLPYKHVIPSKYKRVLIAKDFADKITFVLPGTMGDGRKGQLPIFYAFVQFYEQHFKANPEDYRDFELVFVGVSDDFLSRQVISHAAALGDHFSYHGKVTWLENLAIGAKANFTICYSIREALPLFVFEGMAAGHPLLRNDSSGMEEQLFQGKNGFLLETNDYDQVLATIEKVLNKKKVSNTILAEMSAYSNKIALQQEKNNYTIILED
jgi:glycosyltransferase involved in cell wall biosynthesis